MQKNAYFTVEAAMVLPMVMGVLVFLVYLLLFQYDRCLMEQDMGRIALWGSGFEAVDETHMENGIAEYLQGNDWEKYVAWKTTRAEVQLEGNVVTVCGGGRVTFPVPGWNFWNGENEWTAEVCYEYERRNPVRLIRKFRKISGY